MRTTSQQPPRVRKCYLPALDIHFSSYTASKDECIFVCACVCVCCVCVLCVCVCVCVCVSECVCVCVSVCV